MVTVDLAEDEVEALETLVRWEIAEVKVEIHHTDDWAYREELRIRQGRLTNCLKRLEEARAHSAA